MSDDTNKVFSKVTGSERIVPDPELLRVLQDSYDVSMKVIEGRVKVLVDTLVPLVERLKKEQEKRGRK